MQRVAPKSTVEVIKIAYEFIAKAHINVLTEKWGFKSSTEFMNEKWVDQLKKIIYLQRDQFMQAFELDIVVPFTVTKNHGDKLVQKYVQLSKAINTTVETKQLIKDKYGIYFLVLEKILHYAKGI